MVAVATVDRAAPVGISFFELSLSRRMDPATKPDIVTRSLADAGLEPFPGNDAGTDAGNP